MSLFKQPLSRADVREVKIADIRGAQGELTDRERVKLIVKVTLRLRETRPARQQERAGGG